MSRISQCSTKNCYKIQFRSAPRANKNLWRDSILVKLLALKVKPLDGYFTSSLCLSIFLHEGKNYPDENHWKYIYISKGDLFSTVSFFKDLVCIFWNTFFGFVGPSLGSRLIGSRFLESWSLSMLILRYNFSEFNDFDRHQDSRFLGTRAAGIFRLKGFRLQRQSLSQQAPTAVPRYNWTGKEKNVQ